MIKAVFLDFDGTLFSHRSVSIPRSAKKALAGLRENGIKVALSTGRHVLELERMETLKDVFIDAYITMNGAYTYDEEGIICDFPITREDVETMYAWLMEHDLAVEFLEDRLAYVNRVNDIVIRSQDMIHEPVPTVYPLERILSHPIYQFIPFGIRQAEDIVAALRHVKVTSWIENDALDLVHDQAGKTAGVKAVLEKWNIPAEEAMAVGDAMNDAGMLKYCGIGAAMGNGSAALKEIADYVTGDIDEDGLYHLFCHYGMISE